MLHLTFGSTYWLYSPLTVNGLVRLSGGVNQQGPVSRLVALSQVAPWVRRLHVRTFMLPVTTNGDDVVKVEWAFYWVVANPAQPLLLGQYQFSINMLDYYEASAPSFYSLVHLRVVCSVPSVVHLARAFRVVRPPPP